MHKVIDLFCGCGGLSEGFKLAGYQIVGGIDFCQPAIDTYNHNFHGAKGICADLLQMTQEDIISNFGKPGEIDVIIGGPPCQGFSSANRWQKEMDDPRNRLFFQFVKFVDIYQPKTILIENVPGIISRDHGYAKKRIYEIFETRGYTVSHSVLNAADYGVPQYRRRNFFVMLKGTRHFEFTRIKKTDKRVTVKEAIGELYLFENNQDGEVLTLIDAPSTSYRQYLRSRDNKVYNHEVHYPADKVQNRISYVPQGGNWRNVPAELWPSERSNRHSSAYKRLAENDCSCTIDTGNAHSNYFHPLYNRIPTPREAARLQSFPDDFVFVSSRGNNYKQIGNAVPPLLAKAVAASIMDQMDEMHCVKKNKIVDLFCGCGGLSYGFEMAGFKVVAAIDMWQDAIKTFNHNHPDQPAFCEDIHKWTNDFLDQLNHEHDIVGVVGGPPCQGFSTVGQRDVNDPRNTLYQEYCRVVEHLKPDFFVLENVKGLMTLAKGAFRDDIIKRFSALGYHVQAKVLNAADYGVPQNRWRVFFVGTKKDGFSFDSIKKVDHIVSTSEAIGDLPPLFAAETVEQYSQPPTTSYEKMMRKGSIRLFNHQGTAHTEQTRTIIGMIKDGGRIQDLPEEYWHVRKFNKAFERMGSDRPSNTVDTGHRNYFHYNQNRIPSVRENARLQSFPDTFEILGTKTSQYKQVGNAVPPLMAFAIAQAIKTCLSK